MKLTKAELVATLREMAETIEQDDSFEGSIQYTCMVDGLGPDEFDVGAFYRVGNSMGQGGAVVIQATPFIELTEWELDLQTEMEIAREEMQRVMNEEDAKHG